jgi:hypothetical protein
MLVSFNYAETSDCEVFTFVHFMIDRPLKLFYPCMCEGKYFVNNKLNIVLKCYLTISEFISITCKCNINLLYNFAQICNINLLIVNITNLTNLSGVDTTTELI